MSGVGLRAGARPYFGPRLGVGSRVGDKMFDGVIPLGGKRCGRSIFLGRPREERVGSSGEGASRGASV